MAGAHQFGGTERFRLLRRLGAGGMGVVYEAVDGDRGGRVAIKTLLRADGEALLRFKREFRALADLHHPNLVSLHELIEHEGEWFFTMELVDGVDFLSHVWRVDADAVRGVDGGAWAPTMLSTPGLGERRARPPTRRPEVDPDLDRLRAAAPQFALGLAALHDAGKVHRDVKPSNVMVADDGRVVILDLGLVADGARDDDARFSSEQVLGTAAYMAPEQAVGRAPGPAADWYSFGAVLFEALTGKLPFDGAPFEILLAKQDREAPRARDVARAVPHDLDELCAELLRRDPDARPSGASVLRRLGVRDRALELGSAPSILNTSTFVGRARELAELMAAYEATVRGEAVTVIVHGESGVGKSALIREFVNQIAGGSDAGHRPVVLGGRCFDNESVRYNAFDGVIDALSQHMRRLRGDEAAALLPRHASLLVRAFPVLAQVEAMAGAPLSRLDSADPDELRTKLLAAVRELFERLAERRPVIVTIDDVQWANRDSLLLLRELLRPPEGPPVLVLASSRPDTPTGGDPAPPDFELPGDVRLVHLGVLSEGAARELAESLLAGVGLGVERAAAIAAEAGGHPLHIDALVRYAAVTDGAQTVPHLDQAILARVGRLDRDARTVIELVCLAGAPVPRGVVARAAELDDDACGRALGVLRLHNLVRTAGAHLADAVEPYHDRVRQSVLGSLDGDTRIYYHGRLAVVLDGSGANAELLMRHQQAAGDLERASRTALRAAGDAAEALAFDRAAELYRTALRLAFDDPGSRRDVQLRLAEALSNAGRGAEAAAVYMEAAAGADAATKLECYRQSAEQYLLTGHLEEGMDTLRGVLSEFGASFPASPQRAMAAVLWTRALLAVRGTGWKARDASTIGRDVLMRVDMFRSVGQGMGMVDTIRGAAFQARGLLLALRAGEPMRVARALCMESIFRSSQGGRSIAKARALIDRARSLAGDDAYLRAWVTSADGVALYFAGDFARAAEVLARGEVQWREQPVGSIWEKNNIRVFRLLALRYRGDMTELGPLADDAIRYAVRRGDRYMETTVRRHTSILWLCADDLDAARANLAAATWVPRDGRFHLQHWYELEAAGELALYEGRAADALAELAPKLEALESSLLTRVQTIRIGARYLAARLWLAEGSADGKRRAAKLARRLCREPVAYGGAYGHFVRAALAQLDGARDRAVAELERAAAEAAVGDMRLLGASIARALGALHGGDDGAAQVEAAERTMVELGARRPALIARVATPAPLVDA